MDTSLFFFINQGLQNIIFDVVMPFITKTPYILFIAIVLPVVYKDWRKGLFVLSLCFIGLALGDGSANILKHTFERLRPCQALVGIDSYREGVRLLVGCGGSYGFPSAHAVNAFVTATIFSHFFRKAALPMFSIAVLVAFSRIYVGVHYPSDVIAGMLMGGIIGQTITALYAWSTGRFQEKPYTTILVISLLALSFFRYYYIATGPADISPDEAHYWEWSRRLDLSYYTKGPLIAYIIAGTTWVLGDTVLAVRFAAPIFLALSSVVMYRLAMELFNDSKKASAAALAIQITPLFAVYGVVMTIDSPFIFFWIVSLYLFWKAIKESTVNSQQLTVNSKYWYLLGLTVGLGLLTKYTMAFFYGCAFLFIVFSKEQRFWLKKKEPYIAFLLSLLVFSPVLIWNADHEWVTLKHTAGQAHVSEGFKISFRYFFEFIGSQIGVVTPLLFFMLIYGVVKPYIARSRTLVTGYLFWFCAPVLGFFILKSLQGKVQANWAMFAYASAFIAAADFFVKKGVVRKGVKLLTGTAVAMALLMTIVTHYSEIIGLPVKMDPTSRLKGWKELGIKTGEVYNSMVHSGNKNIFIFSDKYQVSSELAFYMPNKPITYCMNLGRRMNQYDIWGGLEGNDKLLGQNAIFVRIGYGDFPGELESAFDYYEKERFVVRRGNKVLREYTIFSCYGFNGIPFREIESY